MVGSHDCHPKRTDDVYSSAAVRDAHGGAAKGNGDKI